MVYAHELNQFWYIIHWSSSIWSVKIRGFLLPFPRYFFMKKWKRPWPILLKKYNTSQDFFLKHNFNISLILTQKGTFKMKGKNYQLELRHVYLKLEKTFMINTCFGKLVILQVIFLKWFWGHCGRLCLQSFNLTYSYVLSKENHRSLNKAFVIYELPRWYSWKKPF